MDMRKPLTALAAVAIAAAVAAPVGSQAQDRTRVGALTCDISGGIGMIIASKKEVTCLFTPSAQNAPREVYTGSITKFGLDIGATSGGEMVWSVFAPSDRKFGALAGNYGGASAEATVGVGAGANVLVGGSNRTVTLQPVSVQGQTGLNLAVGVSGLELRPAR
ncbi:MAG TPA: DUF992 domain-containing protein [Pseudolabrys sp.]|nr:DUF992 domain-containing protein [Pseudolabrys sp.]